MHPLFEIVRFTATDRVELAGFWAGGRKLRVAIYLHGLGGNGYRSAMVPALAGACVRRGMAFFSINTRGHDLVATRTRGTQRDPHNGAVYEVFTECVHDIRGAIRAARARGARDILLIGHSTGANKIAYALQHGVRVQKVVYLAPGDDVGIQRKILGTKQFAQMQRLAARWRKRAPHRLMPVQNLGYLAIGAASYHSLFGEKNRMDQFPFRDLSANARWRRLVRSRPRALMVLGADDEYLPTPAAAIRNFFAAAYPHLPVRLIPRASHSFTGRESAMAQTVAEFLD